MEVFHQKEEKSSKITYIPALFLILTLVFFVVFTDSFSQSNLEHERKILQNALDRTIIQCYALEGTYPFSISYLEENYGLTYNKEHFFVDYQYIGDNLRPDVTILERD